MNQQDIIQHVRQLEDKTALRTLIDTFAILSDRKDIETQVQLFTEDASVNSYLGGQLVSSLKGRQQLAEAFGGFLAQFDTVYHQNGQQTVELDGDRATGIAYCLTVLIGRRDGRRVMTTSGVTYKDEYVRSQTGWLISKRVTRFDWQREDEMPAGSR
jgi:ketosteroid isomerase-like protein